MPTLSIPGFLSVSKIAIKLLLNSFILGPLAVIYALLAEVMLSSHRSVLFDEPQAAIVGIVFGGFLCSFACMAASIVLLLPIALIELNGQAVEKSVKAIFSKYLPMPVLLFAVLGLVMWSANEFEPMQQEASAILFAFYLTASTGLFLLAKIVSNYSTKM